MTAEQIIKSKTPELTTRHDELIDMYQVGESPAGTEFLLEEAALIEVELKNRGLKNNWQPGTDA